MSYPSINSVNVPASMSSRGVYKFETQANGTVSGAGSVILAGPQSVLWRFSWMTPTELAWWRTTILGDAASVPITAAELWDDDMTQTAFTAGILYRPNFEAYRGGIFWGITVEIRHLLPLVLT